MHVLPLALARFGFGENRRLGAVRAYEKAVANATYSNGVLTVPKGDYGPVGTMMR